jgi:hypothetical protein
MLVEFIVPVARQAKAHHLRTADAKASDYVHDFCQ